MKHRMGSESVRWSESLRPVPDGRVRRSESPGSAEQSNLSLKLPTRIPGRPALKQKIRAGWHVNFLMEIDSFLNDLYGLARQGKILWGSDAQHENQQAKGANLENSPTVSAVGNNRMKARQFSNPYKPGRVLLLRYINGYHRL